MKHILLVPLLLLGATQAMADPVCTDAARDTWIPADQMQQNIINQGYSIKKFKETRTGCYEIYGYDSEKHRVEIYFNPVSGDIVKKEIDD
ncbi:PepSY domain-containing protein [Marinobacterium sedimentorum]|uniref:PepSY domain-containing protein n=1 Tax=Marinobacterium sedimentorum TaxID=2927804 RepID=UPI0020C5D48B|nr:PepSY domain-containing protein [Marinobacterium sedimentorum]MCP8686700.1 PepSY domain-containing protein [Marinobacterium sedimentorum]